MPLSHILIVYLISFLIVFLPSFGLAKMFQKAGVDIVTIGQYLQPSLKKLRVKAFIHPDTFAAWAAYGKEIGLSKVYAGPFVRSSYHAREMAEMF